MQLVLLTVGFFLLTFEPYMPKSQESKSRRFEIAVKSLAVWNRSAPAKSQPKSLLNLLRKGRNRNWNRGDSKSLRFQIASGLDLKSLAIWAPKRNLSLFAYSCRAFCLLAVGVSLLTVGASLLIVGAFLYLQLNLFCLQCESASNKHLNRLQAKKRNRKQKELQL